MKINYLSFRKFKAWKIFWEEFTNSKWLSIKFFVNAEFTKENNLPVALIQNDSKKGYVLKNLSTSEEKQVNNEVAQELEPIGYMFLSGFDRKMSSIKEVLSFAMKGLKNDTN